jgi:hypothetical protein
MGVTHVGWLIGSIVTAGEKVEAAPQLSRALLWRHNKKVAFLHRSIATSTTRHNTAHHS